MDKHKKRASCIWAILIALIVSYAIWLVISIVAKRKNPSVSLKLEVWLWQ